MNERIKTLRAALGISQDAFAEKLNLSRNYVWMLERGDRNLSERSVLDICRIFNVSEEWLRNGTGEMFQPRDRNSEIADIVAEMYKNDESDFRFQLTKLLYELSADEIALLKNIALKLVADTKEDPAD